jgi:hypothetical protein
MHKTGSCILKNTEKEYTYIFLIRLFTSTYAEQSPNCDGLLFVIVKTKFEAYVAL